eukprot:gene7871-9347_t
MAEARGGAAPFCPRPDLCSSDGPVEVELPVQDLGASNGAGGTVSIE